MLRVFLSLSLLLSIGGISIAQPPPPDTLWTRFYGGNEEEEGSYVEATPDGGYIITGTETVTSSNYHIFLLKTDSLGNQQWYRTYNTGHAYSVHRTSDGGFIIGGTAGGGASLAILIKVDSLGISQWSRTYGVFGNQTICTTMQKTSDNGYILGGHWVQGTFPNSTTGIFLLKTDGLGNQQWSDIYGDASHEFASCVQQTADGGYILVGNVGYSDFSDVYLLWTDALGNEIWSREFGGNFGQWGHCVRQTIDGGYIIAGVTDDSLSSLQAYLVKTDWWGNVQWSQNYGGNNVDAGNSVRIMQDAGFIICGYTQSSPTCDIYIVRTDSIGNLIWEENYGGTTYDEGNCIQVLEDNSFIITGYADTLGAIEPNIYLVKLEAEETGPIITLNLEPINPPIIIPTTGGIFQYNISVTNSGSITDTFLVWNMVSLPNGTNYGPVLGPAIIILNNGSTIARVRNQSVPANAPAGNYIYHSYAGVFPNTVISQDSFTFTKSEVGREIISSEVWSTSNWDEDFKYLNDEANSSITHHSSFIISASPNPFNSSVALRFELSDASSYELTIYDINGREVWRLETRDSRLETNEVVWDAEGMPSGIYFAQLSVDGGQSMVRKVVLMK
jgi:hypothetical protein